ncbi:hypothetical protein QWY84_06240 [Aquisalimonas lutea]|uniref:hypothetical protein n=1 Tax=Aquisalimonas lutea TaxID=1327750 RepID=UPI0025B49922|nr:hypothetical protein [Aquisalimonas lutea]MDN3517199.1 hypothetical protein [Aquisalimonas lutea]
MQNEQGVLAHHGEWLSPQERSALKDLDAQPGAGWKTHRGSVIRIDGLSHAVHLATDLVGSFPIYYSLNSAGDRFVAGSHFAEVRAQTDTEMDPIGCYEFLTKGFTVGARTIANGVHQLTMQETLTVSIKGDTIDVHARSHPDLWTSESSATPSETHDRLTDLWLSETALLDHTQLMMSAGWDSRVLLAGIVANRLEDSLIAYSHGDVDGRELRIAGRLCEAVHAKHTKAPLARELFAPDMAHRILAEVDTYIFPYWWQAASVGLENHHAHKITGGLYGPILGGHNNVPDKGSNSHRLLALARYLAGGSHPANGNLDATVAAARELIVPHKYHWQWCVADDVHEHQAPWMLQAVQADMEECIHAYSRTGIRTVENIVEAFEVDHRLRQYINGQLLSGSAHLPARNPFTNPETLRLAAAQPLSSKVHNILHQAIIKRIAPQLLRHPMAATLIPASAPISLQEVTRIQRILFEGVAARAHTMSKGTIKKPRLGWPAFGFLKNHQPFHDLVDSLQLPIWDKDRMHRTIYAAHGNLHPIFDMIARCKTLDYRLTAVHT